MKTGHKQTGSKLFAKILEEYGVTHLFGNPGTTELPILNAVEQSDIEYVLTLHEDVAVGAAAGYASTRRYHVSNEQGNTPLTAVNLHLTPGVAHGIGNLYGAAYSGAPVLVTAGAHATAHQSREPVLSGDTLKLVEDSTKWSAAVKDIDELPRLVRRAARTALTPPTGPVFLELPYDIQIAETDREPKPLGQISEPGPATPETIDRAVDLLARANEPVFVVGDHVARTGQDAVDATVTAAEILGGSRPR